MKFVIEQLALRPADPAKAKALLTALGAATWVGDRVTAEGRVSRRGSPDDDEPSSDVVNVADLSFNYEMSRGDGKPLEVELLDYRAGENWIADQIGAVVSHLGMHCKMHQLPEVDAIMKRHNCFSIQDVITTGHTNPAIKDTRRYRYVIYDTRRILGVDLKFIVRLNTYGGALADASEA